MIKFKNIHIYRNHANNLDFNFIVPKIQKYFPKNSIEVINPFLNDIDNELAERLNSIIISDIKKPFEKQPKIKVQGILDNDIVFERNFQSQLILMNSGRYSKDTEKSNKELILYDGFM